MKHYFLLFLFLGLNCLAQIQIRGIVKDSNTNKPIPFASITLYDGNQFITDVDGKFNIEISNGKKFSFTVSHASYTPKKITGSNTQFLYTIFLDSADKKLVFFDLKKREQALYWINNVIENKSRNNPEQALKSFQFKAYNKIKVAATADSIQGIIDSIYKEKRGVKKLIKIDSTEYKFKNIVANQHLFLAEKVAIYSFSKPNIKETIIASRISGLQNPVYELFGFELQSFSLYDHRYTLFETNYKSPLDSDYVNDYHFLINDTVSIQGRKSIVVHFKNNKTKKGLEGLLYIDTENFGINKAVLRIRSLLNITSTHEFVYLPEHTIWFPKSKEIILRKGKSKERLSLLGGRIVFEPDGTNVSKKGSDFTYLQSYEDYFDIQTNEKVNIKTPAIKIEVKQPDFDQINSILDKNRTVPFDEKDKNTYFQLDSLSLEKKIDKKISIGRKLFSGFVPLAFMDFDLRNFVSFNNYEGFRLGIGGATNDKLSSIYKFDGYFAYGIKDAEVKYNLGFGIRLGKSSQTWASFSYTDDIREIASISFATDKRTFKIYDPRPINISTFYNYKTWKSQIETKIIPKTESIWMAYHSRISTLFPYTFDYNNIQYSDFTITAALVGIQWNPFSEYLQAPENRIEVEKHYPKFTFQLMKTLPGLWENDFDFGKFDLRIDYEKKFINGQKTMLLSQLGYAFGTVPITHLYNNSPNNITKDVLLQRITFGGKNSFETMFFNEFFSDRYISFQVKHGFKRVKFSKSIKPEFVLVTRMAWGNLNNTQRHIGLEFKTMEQGFFESGIEFNKIFKGFGLSGFYRYGPYQLPKLEDNIAIKISFSLDLGL